MPAQDSTRWWLAAEAAVACALVSLLICLGGAPAWTSWVLLGWSGLALACWAVGAARHGRRATWHPLLLVPFGLALIAAASLVPLPAPVLALLSPANAELRDFALVPLGLDGPRPVAVDPPSTWRALARALSLGTLAFVALQLGRLQGARKRLLSVVAGAGGLTMAVGIGHLLARADSLFGLWRFSADVPLLSFFGNQNHLAAYLAFSATVGLALALDARSKEVSVRWIALALFCGVGVFLSLSRGGTGSFLVTLAVVGAFQLVRKQGSFRAALPWLVMVATGVFALLLASEQLLERAASVSTRERIGQTKLELWPLFWDAALGYWRAGMGLGGWEAGFSRFQSTQLGFTFTHPENLVLQWAAELGLPLAAALSAFIVASGWSLARQVRGAGLELVCLAAVLGVGLHDLFDFALELNALAAAVVVVVGVCAAREREGAPALRRAQVTWRWLTGCAAVVLIGAFAASRGLPPHADAEARVLALVDQNPPAAAMREAALAAIDRHPADWVLYSAVAHQLSRDGAAREALAWVNRVLFLRPGDATAHVAAARALARLGQTTQALLEYKLAWSLGDLSSLDEGLLLASEHRLHDRLVGETPGLTPKVWHRFRLMGRLGDGAALLAAIELLPPSKEILAEARVLGVHQAGAEQRWSEALSSFEALPEMDRARPELLVVRANALAQVGRIEEAIAELDQFSRRAPGDLEVAMTLAFLLGQAHRAPEGRAVLERTRPFLTRAEDRSFVFVREADLWMVDERYPRALEALKTASRIEPARADLKYRVAQAYELMGSLRSALETLREARLLDTPEGARARDAWVARLEEALRREAVP